LERRWLNVSAAPFSKVTAFIRRKMSRRCAPARRLTTTIAGLGCATSETPSLTGAGGKLVIATCSALKRAYRDCLREQIGPEALFVLLHGERDLLKQRLDERTHRYMPSSLLDSQPETLEQPETDECALSLDIAETPADLVRTIERELARLGITRPPDQAAGVSER
jgi:hypothetical protein